MLAKYAWCMSNIMQKHNTFEMDYLNWHWLFISDELICSPEGISKWKSKSINHYNAFQNCAFKITSTTLSVKMSYLSEIALLQCIRNVIFTMIM